MFELVLANLKTRPFRTLISIIGVALGVILVVLFTGLATGMTNDMSKRASNWKAEIVFSRSGGMEMTSSGASVPTAYANRLVQIEGVESAVPIYRYIAPNPNGTFGLQQIEGVEWEPFSTMNDIQIVQGRAAQEFNEVVLDEIAVKERQTQVGGEIDLFGKKYTVAGIFAPESGARIKMSLAAMQDAQQNPGKCSYILVKIKDGADVEAVANRINEVLSGNKINLTRDLFSSNQNRIPALNTFLRVLVGLGAFVSTIFVLLSMYTTVTERRKEIGILKSLGASKSFIIRVIEGEALMIGILGVLLGFVISIVASLTISRLFDLQFEFTRGWVLIAFVIAIGGSLFGALYPAWKASGIDPVEVMANE
jgi:putative ABC transport system permease protein